MGIFESNEIHKVTKVLYIDYESLNRDITIHVIGLPWFKHRRDLEV